MLLSTQNFEISINASPSHIHVVFHYRKKEKNKKEENI